MPVQHDPGGARRGIPGRGDPLRAVADTSVVVSALLGRGRPPREIILAASRGEVTLLANVACIREYRHTLFRPDLIALYRKRKIDTRLVRSFFDELLEMLERVGTAPGCTIPEDHSDVKFTEAAVAGNADFVVAEDKHLLRLGSCQNIAIVDPQAFMAELWSRRKEP